MVSVWVWLEPWFVPVWKHKKALMWWGLLLVVSTATQSTNIRMQCSRTDLWHKGHVVTFWQHLTSPELPLAEPGGPPPGPVRVPLQEYPPWSPQVRAGTRPASPLPLSSTWLEGWRASGPGFVCAQDYLQMCFNLGKTESLLLGD